MGPSLDGRCPQAAECAPLREGDRWVCNRPRLRGGPCEDRPIRSLRSRRRTFVATTTVFLLGCVMFSLSAPWRNEILAPGPLSRAHSLIVDREQPAQRCLQCHTLGDGSVWSWLAAIPHGSPAPAQSQLCVECHDRLIEPSLALAAHSVPRQTLLEKTQLKTVSWIDGNDATSVLPSSADGPAQVACSACHREHGGKHADISAISAQRCQACHSERYDSFDNQHPEFDDWPFQRRSRIAFDHASHRSRHFPAENAEFACARCHVDDESQNVKLLADYETSCKSCHEEAISASLAEGLPLLGLPTVDTELLNDIGHRLDAWPAEAVGEFDGPLPAPMIMLLADDLPARRAMQALASDVHFADVDLTNPLHLQAAAQLARSILRLAEEIRSGGQETIRQRLQGVLDRPIDDQELAQLAGRLSPPTIDEMASRWLLTSHRGQADAAAQDVSSTAAATPSALPAGSWFYDPRTLSIRYRPTGHADPWQVAWIEALIEWESRDDSGLAAAQRERWTRADALGGCATCHSVDRLPDGGVVMNWWAADRRLSGRQFTKFSHRPHLVQPLLRDCTHCHSIDDTARPMTAYAGKDPHEFVSGFLPVSKQTCSTCHNARADGDSCQLCHNYHVSPWVPHPEPRPGWAGALRTRKGAVADGRYAAALFLGDGRLRRGNMATADESPTAPRHASATR